MIETGAEAPVEAELQSAEYEATPSCGFEVSTPASLDAVAGAPSLPSEDLRFALTWSDTAGDWLGQPVSGETEATLRFELASIEHIEVRTPRDRTSPLCQRTIELELGAHLRTADGALDSPATASVTMWPTRTAAELRLTTEPKPQGVDSRAALVAVLELGTDSDPGLRLALAGREYGAKTSPTGKPTAVVGEVPLARTAVAPVPADVVPGSLTERAVREAQRSSTSGQ